MGDLVITIPAGPVAALNVPPEKAAVKLYEMGRLSTGAAAEFAIGFGHDATPHPAKPCRSALRSGHTKNNKAPQPTAMPAQERTGTCGPARVCQRQAALPAMQSFTQRFFLIRWMPNFIVSARFWHSAFFTL